MLSQTPDSPRPPEFPEISRARGGPPGGGGPGGGKISRFFPPGKIAIFGHFSAKIEAPDRAPPVGTPPKIAKNAFLLSRLGELLNTQKNVHFLPPPGRAGRAGTHRAPGGHPYVGGLRPPTTLMP